jgi:glycosyltransferase involved in cell wall biosynthesis
MCIWFPVVRAESGSDVYFKRLVASLQSRGIDARLQWFNRYFELQPTLLNRVQPPVGTRLIHAGSWNGFAFARRGLPMVATAFHSVYRRGYPLWKTLPQRVYHDYWIGAFERRTFERSTAVVAMSPSAAHDFSEHFELPKLTLIPGWVDTDIFRPAQRDLPLNFPVRILIVGNGSKRKGVDLLPFLRAKLSENYHITVVGGLRANWKGIDAGVTFKHGLSQLELVKEYQAANLVVSLSRYEGFGYTALEAMACGRPVVAFDVTGIRDIVMPGVTGYLVKQEDVDAMATICMRLGSDAKTCDEMGSAARARVLELFGESEALEKYIGLYRSLMS